MKPPPFAYHRPTDLDEALAMLAEVGHDGKVLAGGQSLVPLLNMRLATPRHLVDINRLAPLSYVRRVGGPANDPQNSPANGPGNGPQIGPANGPENGFVEVGALARHADVERDAAAFAAVPLLRQATACVAHPAIRNRGTTVGSLVHA